MVKLTGTRTPRFAASCRNRLEKSRHGIKYKSTKGVIRSGFAARCEAGLRPAGKFELMNLGCALGSGSAPRLQGQRPNRGHSPS